MIGLGCERHANETWREAVKRIAKSHGLTTECLESFDHEVKAGEDEAQAALNALCDWDCLSTIDANEVLRKAHGRADNESDA